jgi:hypothetical protein
MAWNDFMDDNLEAVDGCASLQIYSRNSAPGAEPLDR